MPCVAEVSANVAPSCFSAHGGTWGEEHSGLGTARWRWSKHSQGLKLHTLAFLALTV